VKAGAARARTVGDTSSAGGAGGSILGEAGKGSSSTGGTSGIMATDGVGGVHGDNGEKGGGVADGGVAVPDREERRSSPLLLRFSQQFCFVSPPPGSLCQWCFHFRQRGRRR
jgi:hypothetical protein